MKIFILLAAMTLSAVAFGAGAQATNEVFDATDQERMFMEAVMLQQQGLYGEAEIRLKRLAELQPDQPTVKQMLADVQLKLKAQQQDPLVLQKRRLEETIIPEVSFREAAPADVFEYLRSESKKYTADKSEINYVWLVPSDAKLGSVTLHLRNVPLGDVIRYVTSMTDLKYRVDPHAVVIFKAEAPATPTPNVKSE